MTQCPNKHLRFKDENGDGHRAADLTERVI